MRGMARTWTLWSRCLALKQTYWIYWNKEFASLGDSIWYVLGVSSSKYVSRVVVLKWEAIQHYVTSRFNGDAKPELMLVPRESRQELWLPLGCFSISPDAKNGCCLTLRDMIYVDFHPLLVTWFLILCTCFFPTVCERIPNILNHFEAVVSSFLSCNI